MEAIRPDLVDVEKIKSLMTREYSNILLLVLEKDEKLYALFTDVQYNKVEYSRESLIDIMQKLDNFIINELKKSDEVKKDKILSML